MSRQPSSKRAKHGPPRRRAEDPELTAADFPRRAPPRDTYYYDLLGVPHDATDEDIRRAYRQGSLRWHPDKNREESKEEAGEMFKLLARAYEVLKDEELRTIYDLYGEDGVKNGAPAAPAEGPAARPAAHTFHSPFDVFHEFFGGHDPFNDPFFHDHPAGHHPFFASRSMHSAPPVFGHRTDPFAMFREDPFFAHGMPGMLHREPFFAPPHHADHRIAGHGVHRMASAHEAQHHAQRELARHHGMARASTLPGFHDSSFGSSMTSFSFGGGGGDGIQSRRTTTRVVDGVRTTEVTTVDARGRVSVEVHHGDGRAHSRQQ